MYSRMYMGNVSKMVNSESFSSWLLTNTVISMYKSLMQSKISFTNYWYELYVINLGTAVCMGERTLPIHLWEDKDTGESRTVHPSWWNVGGNGWPPSKVSLLLAEWMLLWYEKIRFCTEIQNNVCVCVCAQISKAIKKCYLFIKENNEIVTWDM